MPSCEKNVRPIDLTLGPEGTRFDPEGMQICNTFVALNSNYFAVGLVRQELLAAQLPRQDGKPVKNDKGSALGILKIGKHKDSLFQSFKDGIQGKAASGYDVQAERWITQVSAMTIAVPF